MSKGINSKIKEKENEVDMSGMGYLIKCIISQVVFK